MADYFSKRRDNEAFIGAYACLVQQLHVDTKGFTTGINFRLPFLYSRRSSEHYQ